MQKLSALQPPSLSKDWIRAKYLKDEDFMICRYIDKADGIPSLIIAQKREGAPLNQGHVTMDISREEMRIIKSQPRYEGDLYAHFLQ